MKKAKQLERYFKGAANHWRISILLLVDKNQGLSVEEITEILDGNFKNISQHTRTLVRAGLLNKKYQGRNVVHFLSPYGKKFVYFVRKKFVMSDKNFCLRESLLYKRMIACKN